MARMNVINPQTATGEAKTLLDAVQAQLGATPNFLRVLANSPAALSAFLGLHHIAGNGALDRPTRERIAVTLAEQNSCEYCLSAHSAIGRKAGLSSEELAANRDGTSQDAKAAAAVAFARALVEHKGAVTQAELDAVRSAGFGDAEMVEIIVHVGMNLLTNILGKASRVEIDFPKVALKQAA
ncbi:carboxymuconolactone decarboxylase family protein [Methylolobus aquaticus]